MAFWSSLLGKKSSSYTPWTGDYFSKIEKHIAAIANAPSLPEFEELEGLSVVGKRELRHHTLFTVRRPKEWLYMLKMARPENGPEAALRIAEEVALLVGLSTSYHLAPFDVLHPPSSSGHCATTFSYCAGDLAGRAAGAHLPAAEVAHYGMQLAAELADLHANGVLHLSIEPSNVLLERGPGDTALCRWRLLLGNFDLRGKRLGFESAPGLGAGPFSAPEQHGRGHVTAQTDIWGLGATLFYLCAGKPPDPQGSAGRLSLSAEYPQWLAQIIGSCLEPNPARRARDGAAVFDAFLPYVRVVSDVKGDEGASKGFAGAPDEQAAVVIADRFLLACANRLGRVEGGPEAVMKDLGHVTRLKEANRLYKAGTPSCLRRSIAIVEGVLGSWDNPASPLGQFSNNPEAASVNPCEPPERWVGKERWGTAGLPIPRGSLWAMLDLECKSLVSLVEEEGRAEDQEKLRRFSDQWLAKGSLGTPGAQPISLTAFPAVECMTHLAQGLRYIGDSPRAKQLIEKALADSPKNLPALFTSILVHRDLKDYATAIATAEQAASVAVNTGNMSAYAKLFLLAGDLSFRSEDWAMAEERYSVLMKEAPTPEIENLRRQVRCRQQRKAEQADLEQALRIASTSRRLEQWFAAADIAFLAQDFAKAKQLIETIRADPRFNLPTDKWYCEELAKLESAIASSPPKSVAPTAGSAQASSRSQAVIDLTKVGSAHRAQPPVDKVFEAVHFKPETRLFTDYAWSVIQEKHPKHWVLAINLAFLIDDTVSDALGQSGAYEALWLLGCMLQRHGGEEICASHSHDDQFTACHDDKNLLEDIAGGIAEVAARLAIYAPEQDGSGLLQKGFDFKYAIGNSYKEADMASMGAGTRGSLTKFGPGELANGLAQARKEGFLVLDGAVLIAERDLDHRMDVAREHEKAVNPQGVMWPEDTMRLLELAATNGSYFAASAALLNAASRSAISRRRAERVNEPSTVVKGGISISGPGGVDNSFVSHATVYQAYSGTRPVSDLPYEKQSELIVATFDREGENRKLVMQHDLLKSQAEGLWCLIVSVGLPLERAGLISNFDDRTDADIRRIQMFLAGTRLYQRIKDAYAPSQSGRVDYDWDELEGIDRRLDEVIDSSLIELRARVLELLAPASHAVRTPDASLVDRSRLRILQLPKELLSQVLSGSLRGLSPTSLGLALGFFLHMDPKEEKSGLYQALVSKGAHEGQSHMDVIALRRAAITIAVRESFSPDRAEDVLAGFEEGEFAPITPRVAELIRKHGWPRTEHFVSTLDRVGSEDLGPLVVVAFDEVSRVSPGSLGDAALVEFERSRLSAHALFSILQKKFPQAFS
jgi:tetratricopeptide (TPR) repeat protein